MQHEMRSRYRYKACKVDLESVQHSGGRLSANSGQWAVGVVY